MGGPPEVGKAGGSDVRPPWLGAYRATQALVLMLKEAMVPVKRGSVSKSHTFILAQVSHLALPSSSSPWKPSPVRMHTPS